MVDEEGSASGTLGFLREGGSKTIKIGPIPASRMVVLILSVAVGVWLSYDVLTRLPHNSGTFLLAIFAFLFSVEMGGALAIVAGVSARAIAKAVAQRIGGRRNPAWNARMLTKDSGGTPQRRLARSRGRS